jgi:hypothetical protein
LIYFGEPEYRSHAVRRLAMHGFAPDDLYLEDAIVLLTPQENS